MIRLGPSLAAALLENVLSRRAENEPMTTDSLRQSLLAHLASWGLKRFESDEAYFQWQRERLSPAEITQLHHHAEQKRRGSSADEVAFYDATVHPNILPVLYSQRYDYYAAIGPRVVSRIGDAQTILDFGCGVGILTTFYARQCPDKTFVGIDRSAASIARAQEQARALGLNNVRFECLNVTQQALSGTYDLIVATHALVQVEQEPGLPSCDWTTFERARNPRQQHAFEERTGIGPRLDRLCAALTPRGRMIVFEKTRQLARRIPFQRAAASRGLRLIEQPEPIRYLLVEEVAEDGPFYVVEKGSGGRLNWDESPEPDEGRPFERTVLQAPSQDPDAPLYENHWPSAQRAWEQLKSKNVIKETTRQEPDGRQLHVELGTVGDLSYLYCANIFDQRQLILIERVRQDLLDAYYQEIMISAR